MQNAQLFSTPGEQHFGSLQPSSGHRANCVSVILNPGKQLRTNFKDFCPLSSTSESLSFWIPSEFKLFRCQVLAFQMIETDNPTLPPNDVVSPMETRPDEVDVKFKAAGMSADIPSFAFNPVDRDSENYCMSHPKRGKAYIFNHEHFNPNLDLKSRSGTAKDRDNLYMRLRELDFEVSYFNDLTYNEMNNKIVELASEDHSERDCVVVAVMSHGDDGILYAKDQQYKPERLWSYFTSDQCPTLAGKPKIFFIQACQGDRLDPGTTMLPRLTETDSPSVAYKIPTHADFLISYSTIPGFYSWRNTTNGSWFIQALCYVLSERGREEDLLSIMTAVSRIVAIGFESNTPQDSNMHQRKQIPCVTSLLTRKIFFKRKTNRRI